MRYHLLYRAEEFFYATIAATAIVLAQPIMDSSLEVIFNRMMDRLGPPLIKEYLLLKGTDFKEIARREKMLLLLRESYQKSIKELGRDNPSLQDRLNEDAG